MKVIIDFNKGKSYKFTEEAIKQAVEEFIKKDSKPVFLPTEDSNPVGVVNDVELTNDNTVIADIDFLDNQAGRLARELMDISNVRVAARIAPTGYSATSFDRGLIENFNITGFDMVQIV